MTSLSHKINKRGQIWIETVIYILIGLALIALVLAFITPRINQEKEKILIEQTIESLNEIDSKITKVLEEGPGNVRRIEIGISRGELFFNTNDAAEKIYFVINELDKPYTEPGVEVKFGRVSILSEDENDGSKVTLALDYSTLADLRFDGDNEERKFNPTSVPYTFTVENLGDDGGFPPPFDIVNIRLVS